MQMTFRWYGEGNDRIKLSDIKQIPGVKGIVWALHDKMPGEIWSEEEIAKVKGVSEDVVYQQTTENAERMFNLK